MTAGSPRPKPEQGNRDGKVAAAPLLLGVAAWALVGVGAFVIVPPLRAILADFGVALPPLTVAVIDAAEWVRDGGNGRIAGQPTSAKPPWALSGWVVPGWVVLAPVAVLTLSALAAWAAMAARGRVTRASSTLLTTLMMFVIIAAVGVLVVAFGPPLISLGSSLGP